MCRRCQKNQNRKGQRLCNVCHAEYMRNWRKTHPLNEVQRMKDKCRSYANVYLRRGKLIKSPCKECGDPNSQMHHPSYKKPLNIIWLCRSCHLKLHKHKSSKSK